MSDFMPSDEQLAILKSIKEGDNVIVDAVAGSGKTTTVLFIAELDKKSPLALITYNARLKEETRERVLKNGITNVHVHSFHSFGKVFYKDICKTDTDLINIVRKGLPLKRIIPFIRVVIDECQDMSPLYYDFVYKFLCNISKYLRRNTIQQCQLVILGDEKQCIYDFPQKGADRRFLTLASKIFPSKNSWKIHSLSTSYRLTRQMAAFINKCCLKTKRIKAVKDGSPVKYIKGNPFTVVNDILREINYMVNVLKVYKQEDIMILSPSVRPTSGGPVKKLENLLSDSGYHVFAPCSDDSVIDSNVTKGKILITSFHQSKGLERKVVFVLTFNTFLYSMFQDMDKENCSNLIYVAITRASERLYLCAEDGKTCNAFPWLDTEYMKKHPEVVQIIESNDKGGSIPSERDEDYKERSVTELTKFQPEERMMEYMEYAKMKTVSEAIHDVNIPDIVNTKNGLYESVADLNGNLIPSWVETQVLEETSVFKHLRKWYIENCENETTNRFILTQVKDIIDNPPSTIPEFLHMINVWTAVDSSYNFRVHQIKEYDWLTKSQVKELKTIFINGIGGIGPSIKFEFRLDVEYSYKGKVMYIVGRIDVLTPTTIWEIKCVDSFTSEHVLQLSLYAYIWTTKYESTMGSRDFCLLNIRTGETLKLTGIQNLDKIMEMVAENHYMKKVETSDEDFIAMCEKRRLLVEEYDNLQNMCMIRDE
jgi:hypothetical protein